MPSRRSYTENLEKEEEEEAGVAESDRPLVAAWARAKAQLPPLKASVPHAGQKSTAAVARRLRMVLRFLSILT